MRKLSRIALVLAVGAVMAAGPAAAYAGDNVAVAVNTKDGTSIFKLAFSIKHVMGDVVDESNAAVAYASCDSCRTVAVAIQIVLVSGDPSVVTPENVSIAINEGCTTCETLASAVQYVLGVGDGPVHLSADALRALTELRNDLRDLLKSDVPFEDLVAGVDAITSRLGDILSTGLVTNPGGSEPPSPTPAETTDAGASPEEATPTPAQTDESPDPADGSATPEPASTPPSGSTETPAPQPSSSP